MRLDTSYFSRFRSWVEIYQPDLPARRNPDDRHRMARSPTIEGTEPASSAGACSRLRGGSRRPSPCPLFESMAMLFTCADSECTSASSLDSSRKGYFRTRSEVARVAPGLPVVAVALSYDPMRGIVSSHRHGWTAPALVDDSGCVTILAPIPSALVKAVETPSIRIHTGAAIPRPRPGRVGRAAWPMIEDDSESPCAMHGGVLRLGHADVHQTPIKALPCSRCPSVSTLLRLLHRGAGREVLCLTT